MHGKWSKENFELHHKANPEIYQMFEKYAIQASKSVSYTHLRAHET